MRKGEKNLKEFEIKHEKLQTWKNSYVVVLNVVEKKRRSRKK